MFIRKYEEAIKTDIPVEKI